MDLDAGLVSAALCGDDAIGLLAGLSVGEGGDDQHHELFVCLSVCLFIIVVGIGSTLLDVAEEWAQLQLVITEQGR
jgi:hypothetical protein